MFSQKSKRIEYLENELAKSEEALKGLQVHNKILEDAFKNVTTLVGASKHGSILILRFQRDGSIFTIQTYAEMGFDVDEFQKQAGLKIDD